MLWQVSGVFLHTVNLTDNSNPVLGWRVCLQPFPCDDSLAHSYECFGGSHHQEPWAQRSVSQKNNPPYSHIFGRLLQKSHYHKSCWQCCVRTTPINTHRAAHWGFGGDSLSRGWHCCIPHSTDSYNELLIVPLRGRWKPAPVRFSTTMEFRENWPQRRCVCIQCGFVTVVAL